jgi:hypothetical protein
VLPVNGTGIVPLGRAAADEPRKRNAWHAKLVSPHAHEPRRHRRYTGEVERLIGPHVNEEPGTMRNPILA